MSLLLLTMVIDARAATRLFDDVAVIGPIEPAPRAALDPLALTDEMREWVHIQPIRGSDDDAKMVGLVSALRRAHRWQFTQTYTGTAAEVFAEGQFNCLGFSHLVVALGRELGVDARYALVEDRRTYQERSELVLSSTHVTAAWGPAHSPRLIEFEAVDDPSAELASQPIDDRRALALHYANRGAELLLIGQPELARDWLERGLEIDASSSELWTNLGVARRRLDDDPGAERAWVQSIALDPKNLSAYRDLAALYLRRSDVDEARELLSIADRPGNDDPFTWLALGDLHVGIDPSGAARFYRRAGRLDPGNAHVLAARAELALLDGDERRASRLVARALERDPDERRARAVQERLK